jgi:hypothetical protein
MRIVDLPTFDLLPGFPRKRCAACRAPQLIANVELVYAHTAARTGFRIFFQLLHRCDILLLARMVRVAHDDVTCFAYLGVAYIANVRCTYETTTIVCRTRHRYLRNFFDRILHEIVVVRYGIGISLKDRPEVSDLSPFLSQQPVDVLDPVLIFCRYFEQFTLKSSAVFSQTLVVFGQTVQPFRHRLQERLSLGQP